MSRTASKLTDSVRRARDGRGTEQDEAAVENPAETPAETPAEPQGETAGESPEPPAEATPAGDSRGSSQEEPPLPRIPSRRVWPD
jgi:hypothetical protein